MKQDLNTEANESIRFFTEHLERLRQYKQISQILKEDLKEVSTEIDLDYFHTLEELVDLSSLITISHLDLIASNKALFNSKSDWEKIFFIKNIYLTIYESLVTYEKYQNFLFNHTIKKRPELKAKLDSVASEIKSFRKNFKYSSHIQLVRNNVSGHICKDFEL